MRHIKLSLFALVLLFAACDEGTRRPTGDPCTQHTECSDGLCGQGLCLAPHTVLLPTAPVLLTTEPPSPSRELKPTLHGQAYPGERVTLSLGPSCQAPIAEVTAGDDGRFSFTIEVPENSETAFYLQAFAHSLSSLCTPSHLHYIHTDTRPEPPAGVQISPPSPSNQRHAQLEGIATPFSEIALFWDATCETDPAGLGPVDADGDFVLPLTWPAEGMHTLYATVFDPAGNTSDCEVLATYHYDTARPAAPYMTEQQYHQIPQPSAGPEEAEFCAPAGTEVFAFALPDCEGDPIAVQPGKSPSCPEGEQSWSLSLDHDLSAYAQSEAGNISHCRHLFTWDAELPSLESPSLIAFYPPSPSTDPNPILHAQGTPQAHIAVYLDAACETEPWQALSDADGQFWLALDLPLRQRSTLYARTTPAAGPSSACEAFTSYWHDDLPPEAPYVPAALADGLPETSNEPLALLFCSEVPPKLYATSDCSGPSLSPTPDDSHSCDGGTPYRFEAEGDVYAQSQSEVGLQSPCSLLATFTLDTEAPEPPQLFIARVITPDPVPDPLADITSLDVVFSVDAEPHSLVRAELLSGESYGPWAVPEDGRLNAELTGVPIASGGPQAFTLTAEDLAGNLSANSEPNYISGDFSLDLHADGHPVRDPVVQLRWPDGSLWQDLSITPETTFPQTLPIFVGMGLTIGTHPGQLLRSTQLTTTYDLSPGDLVNWDLDMHHDRNCELSEAFCEYPVDPEHSDLPTEITFIIPTPPSADTDEVLLSVECGDYIYIEPEELEEYPLTRTLNFYWETCPIRPDNLDIQALAYTYHDSDAGTSSENFALTAYHRLTVPLGFTSPIILDDWQGLDGPELVSWELEIVQDRPDLQYVFSGHISGDLHHNNPLFRSETGTMTWLASPSERLYMPQHMFTDSPGWLSIVLALSPNSFMNYTYLLLVGNGRPANAPRLYLSTGLRPLQFTGYEEAPKELNWASDLPYRLHLQGGPLFEEADVFGWTEYRRYYAQTCHNSPDQPCEDHSDCGEAGYCGQTWEALEEHTIKRPWREDPTVALRPHVVSEFANTSHVEGLRNDDHEIGIIGYYRISIFDTWSEALNTFGLAMHILSMDIDRAFSTQFQKHSNFFFDSEATILDY